MTTKEQRAASYMAKAERACESARALFDLHDVDGAANRAYYAMFDAAHAALLMSGASIREEVARTHSGLIGAFGERLVKTGRVSKDMGRTLNRAEEIRLIADYKGDSVEVQDAQEMIERAESFVLTLRQMFIPESNAAPESRSYQRPKP